MKDNQNNLPEMHIVDVSKIYNGQVQSQKCDFEFLSDDNTFGLTFDEPIKVRCEVYEKARGKYNAQSLVSLKINVSGNYTCQCARCVKELTKTFDIDAEYGVTRSDETENEDYVYAPGGMLDVSEIAKSLFYLELPTKVLCSQDCRGLCPVCGKDLNSGTCSCKVDDGANKLSGLKKLLDGFDS